MTKKRTALKLLLITLTAVFMAGCFFYPHHASDLPSAGLSSDQSIPSIGGNAISPPVGQEIYAVPQGERDKI